MSNATYATPKVTSSAATSSAQDLTTAIGASQRSLHLGPCEQLRQSREAASRREEAPAGVPGPLRPEAPHGSKGHVQTRDGKPHPHARPSIASALTSEQHRSSCVRSKTHTTRTRPKSSPLIAELWGTDGATTYGAENANGSKATRAIRGEDVPRGSQHHPNMDGVRQDEANLIALRDVGRPCGSPPPGATRKRIPNEASSAAAASTTSARYNALSR